MSRCYFFFHFWLGNPLRIFISKPLEPLLLLSRKFIYQDLAASPRTFSYFSLGKKKQSTFCLTTSLLHFFKSFGRGFETVRHVGLVRVNTLSCDILRRILGCIYKLTPINWVSLPQQTIDIIDIVFERAGILIRVTIEIFSFRDTFAFFCFCVANIDDMNCREKALWTL